MPLPDGLEIVDGASPMTVRLEWDEERTIEVKLRCKRWGAHLVGELFLRAHDRLDLFGYEGTLDRRQPLKVYPRAEQLRSLVMPLETQVFTGNQVARNKGDGIEFADLRRYEHGDPLRRINWRASARRNELWVNESHPERNTDVIIFLDTFVEAREEEGESTLDVTVRAAATLADRYLERKDRVGLISFGGYLNWLLPGSGLVQLYRIVDSLLDTEIILSYAWKSADVIPPRTLPPKALDLRRLAAARRARRDDAPRSTRARVRPRGAGGVAGRVRVGVGGRARGARVPVVAAEARRAARALPALRRPGRRMARGRAARGSTRGGGSIQASSQIFARVGAAVAALLGAAGIGAAITLTADSYRPVVGVCSLIAVVVLAFGLTFALTSVFPWPLVILAALYAWTLGGGEIDQWAPFYAGAFLAVAELAYWSVELRGRAHDKERLNERRAGLIVVLALIGVVAGGFVLAATSLDIGSGIGLDLVGVAAAVGALVVVARLAHGRT